MDISFENNPLPYFGWKPGSEPSTIQSRSFSCYRRDRELDRAWDLDRLRRRLNRDCSYCNGRRWRSYSLRRVRRSGRYT